MALGARTKSIILIVASVGVGILIGALIQARLAQNRLERLALLRSERGFVRALERVIDPSDEAQREEIQEVLERSAQRMAAQMMQNREATISLLDSTIHALHDVLTEEQISQLNERMQQWEHRGRGQRERGSRFQRRRDRERRPPQR